MSPIGLQLEYSLGSPFSKPALLRTNVTSRESTEPALMEMAFFTQEKVWLSIFMGGFKTKPLKTMLYSLNATELTWKSLKPSFQC